MQLLYTATVFTLTQNMPAETHAPASSKPKAPTQERNNTQPSGSRANTADEAAGLLATARVFSAADVPVRRMANGGESRTIVHGTLATGETVNLHESVQPVGATPNAPHVIHHSEFIVVRAGELEFDHELNGKMVSESAHADDVLYIANGTMHTVKNVGQVPATYIVVAIGGDAK
jgi:mannose-6-phosphate isomerase-like protein (cupin superfamily)